MLTREEARTIAFTFITDLAQKAGRQYVILEEKVIEKPYAWVFPFNTKEYAETGNVRAMVLGTGPIVVNRQTGAALMAPPMPIQQYLTQYEETLPTNFHSPATEDGNTR
ncbi:YrhB family protein [Hymenobacter tibetensis]|uniref:YrhB family protein n=1 Tax=Hymenobacter tibetensis TaxID=497967 RepID=A0ABY4CWR8_9BACT|nr:YrhB domain-containing protein [Hymenobacter tibetensis]UOG74477.1 YrhB family protein [Hymenobacter tibetensis]